ncbi:MAG: D-aminoacyl-tRNA deacylase [Candidatus Bathyarchaeia archaeon]
MLESVKRIYAECILLVRCGGMILIVASRDDLAGLNIADKLIKIFGFRREDRKILGEQLYMKETGGHEEIGLLIANGEIVNMRDIPPLANLKMIIFVSRHSSKSGTPTLSVHTPGNIGEAFLGGISRKVSISPASAMKAALIELKAARDEMNLPYEVSYECTHHGPSLDIPAMFVELGSTYEQWRDQKAAEAIARGAIAAAENKTIYPAALGIGGQHYNEKFTRIALTSDIAFGHMIPKYALSYADEYIIRECIKRTVERVDKIVLDWKGIRGEDKQPLLEILKNIGLKIEKV